MAEPKYSIDRDLNEAKALVDHLVPYVYEQELYGSIGGMFGSGTMPALTIGALLMRLRRLHALGDRLTAQQKALLDQVDARNDEVQREWSIHYNAKMLHEAESRLKMMDTYFKECQDDPRSCAANYPPEALRRTIVQDILDAARRYNVESAKISSTLNKADSQLRRIAQQSDFLWAPDLQAAYPPDKYWWLYARPARVTAS